MKRCSHTRHGIVTNQDPSQPYDPKRSHASRAVCDRGPCIDNTIAWVASQTNETAAYYADADRP
jgi:hypothetical protein